MRLLSYPCFLILLFLVPFFTVGQDLQKPFKECDLQGSTTVYDYRKKQWTFTDKEDAQRASLPASTFKILNSLILLEEKAVKDEHEVLKWDGQKRFVPAWNADTDLKNAFTNSTVWFYVRLAGKIGKDTYLKYFKRIGYGNGKLQNSSGADFWNYGDFALSPKEQIEFLVKLYEEKLPFPKENIKKVKQMMVTEQTPTYSIRAKTGWTTYGGMDSGWWVGYVETNGNVYFFATRVHKDINTPNDNFVPCRKSITKKVLQQLNILPPG